MGWTTAISTALTVLAMVGVKFLFPSRLDDEGPTLEELTPVYKTWSLAGVPIVVTAMVGSGFAWYYCLHGLAGESLVDIPNEVWIRPGAPVFGCAALALGFSTGVLVTYMLYWVLLGERMAEFNRYDELAAGYNVRLFLALFCAGLYGVGILGAILATDWEIGFTPKEIVMNRGLSIGPVEYSYDDVVSVKVSNAFIAPNGRQVAGWNGVVDFRDGTRWGSRESPDDLAPADMQALFEWIAANAELELQAVPVFQRKDL